MNKIEKGFAVLLIATGLIAFVAGAGAGIFYQIQHQPSATVIKQVNEAKPTLDLLNSKLLQTLAVYGYVQKIDGRNITLTSLGDTMTINIQDDARIFSALATKDSRTGKLVMGEPQPVKFDSIKLGEGVNVTLKPVGNGQLAGNSVYIFFAPTP